MPPPRPGSPSAEYASVSRQMRMVLSRAGAQGIQSPVRKDVAGALEHGAARGRVLFEKNPLVVDERRSHAIEVEGFQDLEIVALGIDQQQIQLAYVMTI